jgi:hypothetical protein
MGIFASNGTLERDYPRPVADVRAAIESLARENGHHLGAISQDLSRYEVTTTRTPMNWGTAVVLTLSPTGSGTRAVIDYDNVVGSPRALLDGRKNARTVSRFMEDLEARL